MKDRKKFAQASLMLAKLIAMAEEDEGVNQLLKESGLFVEPDKVEDKSGDEDEGGEAVTDKELDDILKAMGEDGGKTGGEKEPTSDELDAILCAFGMDN